jgi:hypothetical protein
MRYNAYAVKGILIQAAKATGAMGFLPNAATDGASIDITFWNAPFRGVGVWGVTEQKMRLSSSRH